MMPCVSQFPLAPTGHFITMVELQRVAYAESPQRCGGLLQVDCCCHFASIMHKWIFHGKEGPNHAMAAGLGVGDPMFAG
jgi:hypothetical protein